MVIIDNSTAGKFNNVNTILIGNNYRICITDEQSTIPYFTIFNNRSIWKSDRQLRLCIKSCDYIHSDNLWKLSEIELVSIQNMLSQSSMRFKEYTNWQVLISVWNWEMLEDVLDYQKCLCGYYDISPLKNLPNYVPSKLTMPNYTRLKIQDM